MKISFQTFLLFGLFFSCTNSAKNPKKIDTSANSILQNRTKMDSDSELNIIVRDYKKQYIQSITIDTVFFIDNDSLKINFKHYCLMDSSISLPKKYLSMYKLDEFITHNFESQIHVTRNRVSILDTTVRKKDFLKFLDSPLINYGVLLYPEIRKKEDEIIIDYSISIPLTDIGNSFSVKIKNDGTLYFVANN